MVLGQGSRSMTKQDRVYVLVDLVEKALWHLTGTVEQICERWGPPTATKEELENTGYTFERVFTASDITNLKKENQMILGNKATDNISGFTGILTGRCEYVNGCIQYEITGDELVAGEPKSLWFDEGRLTTFPEAPSGGPQNSPSMRHP